MTLTQPPVSAAAYADTEKGSSIDSKLIVKKIDRYILTKFFLMTILCYIGKWLTSTLLAKVGMPVIVLNNLSPRMASSHCCALVCSVLSFDFIDVLYDLIRSCMHLKPSHVQSSICWNTIESIFCCAYKITRFILQYLACAVRPDETQALPLFQFLFASDPWCWSMDRSCFTIKHHYEVWLLRRWN